MKDKLLLGLPQPFRSRKARLDNLALLPASLLPHKDSLQALANQLPAGSTLIILPTADTAQRRTLEKVAELMRTKGQRVRTVAAEQVAAPHVPECAVHRIPMVQVQGKWGPFWSCHQKNRDGRWCSYQPTNV